MLLFVDFLFILLINFHVFIYVFLFVRLATEKGVMWLIRAGQTMEERKHARHKTTKQIGFRRMQNLRDFGQLVQKSYGKLPELALRENTRNHDVKVRGRTYTSGPKVTGSCRNGN